jgi:hypothetical protein
MHQQHFCVIEEVHAGILQYQPPVPLRLYPAHISQAPEPAWLYNFDRVAEDTDSYSTQFSKQGTSDLSEAFSVMQQNTVLWADLCCLFHSNLNGGPL